MVKLFLLDLNLSPSTQISALNQCTRLCTSLQNVFKAQLRSCKSMHIQILKRKTNFQSRTSCLMTLSPALGWTYYINLVLDVENLDFNFVICQWNNAYQHNKQKQQLLIIVHDTQSCDLVVCPYLIYHDLVNFMLYCNLALLCIV